MDDVGTDAQPDLQPDMVPRLDEFLLARIAEDKRIAVDAAAADGEGWAEDGAPASGTGAPAVAEHVARHDPERVLADCAARLRAVLACRDSRPDYSFLGARPRGLPEFTLTPADQHQLAALTLALLALPYAGHPEYQEEWRP